MDYFVTPAQKHGDSLIIRIPKNYTQQKQIKERDQLKVVLDKTGIIIPKRHTIPKSWQERNKKNGGPNDRNP